MTRNLRALVIALGVAPTLPATAQEITPFVESNAIHTLFHEIGHAIIDQFQLPVIGQEEDAADAFATIEIITLMEDDAKPILIDVAASWLFMDAQIDREDLDFYDVHDLDAQRAYRTICHLYGLDPDAHQDAADWAQLPDDTLEVCEETAPLAYDSWEALLSEVLLEEGTEGAEVSVTYGQTGYIETKQALEKSGLLDDLAHYAQLNFDWPDRLDFEAAECGEANAFWDSQTTTVTLCYELLREWADIERELDLQ